MYVMMQKLCMVLWATMYPRCWKDNTNQRLGLGFGFGQKYVKNEDGDFIKEEA